MWTATGTVASLEALSDPTLLAPDHPITAKESRRQWDAALLALRELLLGAGPWRITATGNGLSYPTSRVSLAVSWASTVLVGAGLPWECDKTVEDYDKAPQQMPTMALADPTARSQLAAAQKAATVLVRSGTIGNTLPWHVRLEGDTTGPSAMVEVIVHRPVASGYGYPTIPEAPAPPPEAAVATTAPAPAPTNG